ncbi:hypothetical protein FRC0337_02180 [Corynebacterium diphtheriae]|uniref:ABC transporter permease n=1 Tax=Corynebacterium diphtheriae TaxID=1717 RepID=A0A6J4WPX6_CORDP|nr:hypothetical protein CDB402_2077 [Corynebacterium diphtheriae INCA 402]AEX70836.1 hypothetical protein CDPW8_2193 [Corynebacterium diphtheriae PW8]AEX73102.1 hypothetical protein CDCE8392_2119 [Corynebacterium diphtheriae CDCE 8392]AWR16933.1 ABC transporter permease protein [Corynebacterium diphtheriae]MBG9221525.1 hypothetical protein [Corynebacterium diphtheriae bv. mitis]MBG9336614.1 hypothetical protein [Corynebacterium diphtheriae bv. gravis]
MTSVISLLAEQPVLLVALLIGIGMALGSISLGAAAVLFLAATIVGTISSGIDQLLVILYAMLALSILVAILGIINTLALNVIERKQ